MELYAIYTDDDRLLYRTIRETKDGSWLSWAGDGNLMKDAKITHAKSVGYTCRKVKVVEDE